MCIHVVSVCALLWCVVSLFVVIAFLLVLVLLVLLVVLLVLLIGMSAGTDTPSGLLCGHGLTLTPRQVVSQYYNGSFTASYAR